MSSRKRLRAARPNAPPPPAPSSSVPSPPSSTTASTATSATAVPTPIPSRVNSTASSNDDASADSVVTHSLANSVIPSVDSTASRFASFQESKIVSAAPKLRWYGSWPRVSKSSASTQVARETILGGTSKPSAAANLSRYDSRKPDETGGDALGVGGLTLTRKSSTLTLGGTKSNKTPGPALQHASTQNSSTTSVNTPTSAAETATPTKGTFRGQSSLPDLKLGPPVGLPPLPGTRPKPGSKATALANAAAAAADKAIAAVSTATLPAKVTVTAVASAAPQAPSQAIITTMNDAAPSTPSVLPPAQEAAPAPAPSQGWFSWVYHMGTPVPKLPESQEDAAPKSPEQPKVFEEPQHITVVSEEQTAGAPDESASERPTSSSGVWSYFWVKSEHAIPPVMAEAHPEDSTSRDAVMEDAPSAPIAVPVTSNAANATASMPNSPAPPATATASAGSTWAFWSRDSRKTTAVTGKSPSSSESGEIAVIGDQSEAHPKPAAGIKMSDHQPSSKPSSMKDVNMKEAVTAASAKKSNRLRSKSMEINGIALGPGTPLPEAPASGVKGADNAGASASGAAKSQLNPGKAGPPNILLPSFQSTYRLKESPSILRQLTQYLLPTQENAKPTHPHLFLAKEPPRVRKAVAIGVHGLFPAAYLRPMIGQPTGTSIRFANHAAEATRRWADSHGYGDCEIEKIALEGEGRIADRVDNLWKLMLNWIDHIRSADLIVLACHSQGVPVGFMLLAKLIELGIVTTARIGVCAMAGVSLGPFPDYKSGLGILMGSAGELWDFGNPESEVSKRYAHALKTALDYGVRVTFVGSIDDQVVPLESAIFSPVHHPYVYRAVFVDGRIHAPDFIAHLIGFACKLRNLGVSDHGLVRELSVPLAGSLYSGEGHSRLYDDAQVYDLALAHTLETANLDSSTKASVSCEIKRHDGLTNSNPYVLPWIMRGLLEEDFVKTELHSETVELVRQFDEWKPVTKALKDVKYRLEAVRSKL